MRRTIGSDNKAANKAAYAYAKEVRVVLVKEYKRINQCRTLPFLVPTTATVLDVLQAERALRVTKEPNTKCPL